MALPSLPFTAERDRNFYGKADWNAIAEVKQTVKIPVIGNGDVRCVADIERMKRDTGCDGVMIDGQP